MWIQWWKKEIIAIQCMQMAIHLGIIELYVFI